MRSGLSMDLFVFLTAAVFSASFLTAVVAELSAAEWLRDPCAYLAGGGSTLFCVASWAVGKSGN